MFVAMMQPSGRKHSRCTKRTGETRRISVPTPASTPTSSSDPWSVVETRRTKRLVFAVRIQFNFRADFEYLCRISRRLCSTFARMSRATMSTSSTLCQSCLLRWEVTSGYWDGINLVSSHVLKFLDLHSQNWTY